MENVPLWIKAVILGIVEGLTEFLPVSSTGHLMVMGQAIDFHSEPFEIIIQLGALMAVWWLFRNRIAEMLWGRPQSGLIQDRLLIKVLVGFLPVLMVGYLTKSLQRDSVTLIAWTTFLGGFVILAVESFRPQVTVDELGRLTWFQAVGVGLGQCLSLCPGVSRSGATIMTGLMMGMSRSVATEFTFLLAIPTMTAASGYQFLKHWQEFDETMGWLLVIGFVTSYVSAFLVVKWLIRFIQTHTFVGFAWYRIGAGGALLYFLSR